MEEESASRKPEISKTQMKKMKRKEKWLQFRGEKRKKEKERKKERRRVALESGEDVGPSRKSLKLNTMEKSNCRIRVAIDCSFDAYMTDRDNMKLAKQLQTSYSVNRRSANPLQFYLCSMSGKIKTPLQATGYCNWDVFSEDKKYLDAFDRESIVYLSSDSPNILETLEEDKIYIIGGLVDHNHHKGLCHSLAEQNGIKHAQLPISDFIEMKTRKVLAVNHVFEILLKFSETKDWEKSFFAAIPIRKGAAAKNSATDSNQDNDKETVESSSAEDDCSNDKKRTIPVELTDLDVHIAKNDSKKEDVLKIAHTSENSDSNVDPESHLKSLSVNNSPNNINLTPLDDTVTKETDLKVDRTNVCS